MNPSELSSKKILVTGASGFIGSHLCRRLSGSGAEVHGTSRNVQAHDESIMQWWKGDLADMAIVRNLISNVKPDVIFHLSSHVAGGRNLELVMPTFHSNLCSTVNLLTVATESGCKRIVLAGSLEEPGSALDESVPCSPYAAAKWACSAYARMFHALYQTPVVIARLFMVYGPAQKDLNKLIPYVTVSLLRNESPKLSSGQRLVDWVYVEDVVDGLIAAAQAPDIEGHTIDLGSGSLVPVRTVVEHLITLIDRRARPLFGFLPDRPMEQVRVADIAKTFELIGWRPSTALEKGLEFVVDWYREQVEKKEIG